MYIYTLTVALLLAIIIIVIHYNLYRYALLHFDLSDEKCIRNYMSLKRVNYDHKVIVSLTTTPHKIKYIKPMIKSILNQTVRIDQIVLNIPKEYKGKAFDSKNIPHKLNDMISIYTCGRNYGKGTKCIPTLLRENDSETLIILLDDIYVYGEDFIENLIEDYKRDPTHCIYGKGVILIKSSFVKNDIVDITREEVNDRLLMRYITAPKKKIERNGYIYPSNFAL